MQFKTILPYLVCMLGTIFAFSLIFLAVANNVSLPVHILGNVHQISLLMLTVFAILSGSLAGFCLNQALFQMKEKHLPNQTKWQVQDAKLVAEVRSDREKQLEAKIQTLEAALRQSLKKSQT